MSRQEQNDRHIIWSDISLDLDDWRESLEELYPGYSDDELYDIMVKSNAENLYDERVNLNIQLSQPIIVIGDLGRWNGRVSGYKMIDSGNIKDCLYSDTDYNEWYVDKYGDLRADAVHHDGTSLGYVEPDEIGTTLATIMMAIINEKEFEITDGILHHKENVDLLPANIELSALEVTMGNVMSRELIMKEYIEAVRTKYDYILIDCMPSLGLMTINALVAADSVLIPVQAAYLPVKGLQQLIHTIAMVKKRLNRQLVFEGILLTMVDFRTNYAKDVAGKVREAYGEKIEIFDTVIPMSVKAAETSAEGVSIFSHCLNGKVAKAYETIAKEVLGNEE